MEVDQKEYESLTADEPPISKIKEHWSGVLSQNVDAESQAAKKLEPSVAKMLVDAIEDLRRCLALLTCGSPNHKLIQTHSQLLFIRNVYL